MNHKLNMKILLDANQFSMAILGQGRVKTPAEE